MSFVMLEEMLRQQSAAFRCFAAGDRAEVLRFTARVKHTANPPATAVALSQLDSQLGSDCSSLRELYSLHDGMTLFCDTNSDAAGFELFAIADWVAQTAEMRECMEPIGFDFGWIGTGAVVGQIPHSGNYLVVGNDGRIYYADHDACEEDPIADAAGSLIAALITDPVRFIYDRGCYTRYSDGTTDTQWIPKQYESALR